MLGVAGPAWGRPGTGEPRLRGQDQQGVAEVDRAALAVGQSTVVDAPGAGRRRPRGAPSRPRRAAPRSTGRRRTASVSWPPLVVARRSPGVPRAAGRPSASRRTRSCRCARRRARRRTRSRPATWPARSCPRPVGPEEEERAGGPVGVGDPRPGSGVRRRRPRRTATRWPTRRSPMISSITQQLRGLARRAADPSGMPVQA